MKDMMIDIETLGSGPNSVIVSIGAVMFDIKSSGILSYRPSYSSCIIDPKEQQSLGMTIDASTVLWWLDQSKEAQNATFKGVISPFKETLETLSNFIHTHQPNTIWANSPSFDLVILRNAYAKAGMLVPWNYSIERDVRTLVSITKTDKVPFTGIQHSALDDCLNQIERCQMAYKKISGVA